MDMKAFTTSNFDKAQQIYNEGAILHAIDLARHESTSMFTRKHKFNRSELFKKVWKWNKQRRQTRKFSNETFGDTLRWFYPLYMQLCY